MTSMAPSSPARARRRRLVALATVLCALLCGVASARQTDRSQPVSIDARSADATARPNGVSHIKGDVVITQGSLKATSDMATVYFDGRSHVKRVLLTGHAHIQQLDDNGGLMKGAADSIDYDVPGGIATLTGHARVDQPGRASASADSLVYNTSTSTMAAQSSGDGRVHLTFTATQQPAAAASAPAPAKTGN